MQRLGKQQLASENVECCRETGFNSCDCADAGQKRPNEEKRTREEGRGDNLLGRFIRGEE